MVLYLRKKHKQNDYDFCLVRRIFKATIALAVASKKTPPSTGATIGMPVLASVLLFSAGTLVVWPVVLVFVCSVVLVVDCWLYAPEPYVWVL